MGDYRRQRKQNGERLAGYSQNGLTKETSHHRNKTLGKDEEREKQEEPAKEMKHTLLHYLDYCKCTAFYAEC